MRRPTYRDFAWDALAGVVREAAETAGTRDGVEVALARLRVRFDAGIDADPVLAGVLDRIAAADETESGARDPINRADEIAAHLAETFKKQ